MRTNIFTLCTRCVFVCAYIQEIVFVLLEVIWCVLYYTCVYKYVYVYTYICIYAKIKAYQKLIMPIYWDVQLPECLVSCDPDPYLREMGGNPNSLTSPVDLLEHQC